MLALGVLSTPGGGVWQHGRSFVAKAFGGLRTGIAWDRTGQEGMGMGMGHGYGESMGPLVCAIATHSRSSAPQGKGKGEKPRFRHSCVGTC